jgi:UDP-N-acetylmuramoyl-L-alanyl-D-glutamate--2,6-diaminopimelate ligase
LAIVADNDAPPDARVLPARPAHVEPHRLFDLAGSSGGHVRGADVEVRGVASSSGLVQPGDLFAALPGAHGHGVQFADEAARLGAVAILTDPDGASAVAPDLPLLVLDSPRARLGSLAARVYGQPSSRVPVFGVTGTSGKTTTTFLVRAGLAAARRRNGLIGTVGTFLDRETVKTRFTTPEAPELQALLAVLVERGAGTVGMEVSSHALAMGRVDGVRFDVAAFTNLSQDHLDFHADMEDYFQAKALLFDGRSRREIVVVDDEWGRRLVRPGTVTVSRDGAAAWTATQVRVAPDGSTRFTVRGPDLSFGAGCRIPGDYNVTNTVLALAILHELGVDAAAVAPAIARAQVRGRMERVDGNQPFLAVVDYSHKPAGVAAALRALRPLTTGRLIIVLGCGGDRDHGKRPVMGEVAARDADLLVVTDDNPRSEDPAAIRAEMLTGARSVPRANAAEIVECGDRRAAIRLAVGRARDGDTVLVAGKGHETGQQVGAAMLPFDDVSVVREALTAQGFAPVDTADPDSDTDAVRDMNRS